MAKETALDVLSVNDWLNEGHRSKLLDLKRQIHNTRKENLGVQIEIENLERDTKKASTCIIETQIIEKNKEELKKIKIKKKETEERFKRALRLPWLFEGEFNFGDGSDVNNCYVAELKPGGQFLDLLKNPTRKLFTEEIKITTKKSRGEQIVTNYENILLNLPKQVIPLVLIFTGPIFIFYLSYKFTGKIFSFFNSMPNSKTEEQEKNKQYDGLHGNRQLDELSMIKQEIIDLDTENEYIQAQAEMLEELKKRATLDQIIDSNNTKLQKERYKLAQKKSKLNWLVGLKTDKTEEKDWEVIWGDSDYDENEEEDWEVIWGDSDYDENEEKDCEVIQNVKPIGFNNRLSSTNPLRNDDDGANNKSFRGDKTTQTILFSLFLSLVSKKPYKY